MRDAGLTVFETPGWETRARSSGGFSSPPLGIQWHHTAGNTNLQANLDWQTEGCPDAPVGNMLLWFDGSCHMVAAGAANTAGKGGPVKMSRGTVPQDSGNSTTWAIEAGNNGVGQEWPQIQIDAYFTVSNELNFKFGNMPTDLFTHAGYCDASCPGRKVDPATAAAVKGPWKPRSVNSSGTWNQDDVRSEAQRRWAGITVPPTTEPGPEPGPEPTTTEEMMMSAFNILAKASDSSGSVGKGSFWAGNGYGRIFVEGGDFAKNILAAGAGTTVNAKNGAKVSDWDDVTAIPVKDIDRLLGPWRK